MSAEVAARDGPGGAGPDRGGQFHLVTERFGVTDRLVTVWAWMSWLIVARLGPNVVSPL